jgi:hypothetical protein
VTAAVLKLDYRAPSEVAATAKAATIHLALANGVPRDAALSAIALSGKVRNPELLRDALLTAIAVRESDLRYKGVDRTAYLAYLMKQGKKATKAIWEAQKAFLEGAYGDAAPRPRGLDPWLTVDPDELSIELFSRDESAYARLAFSNDLFEARSAAHGTASVDLTPSFVEQLERVRAYQPLELDASTERSKTPAPREVEVPDEWLRGFLQVQSAATLPAAVIELAPIDVYNVLVALRLRRAKTAPRALRFELVPGEKPRIVLEPWETTLYCHGPAFAGDAPRIVRVFGRQRLLVLARALPHLTRARVHLLGPGLPSFWVLDLGSARLSVALTSWSESSWASAASFDALMPGAAGTSGVARAVALLENRGPLGLAELSQELGESNAAARALLQRACLRGQALFDVASGRYRPRALATEPIDEARIRYGSEREALAHRLLGDGARAAGTVELQKEHEIVGEGYEIAGEVTDQRARRSFTPRFTLDLESQVKEGFCNCRQFQRSGLREGPCEHILALYLKFRRKQAQAEELRQTPEGRRLVRAETRTLVRRDLNGGQVSFRVSLDDRRLSIEERSADPGQPFGQPRFQRLWFDTDIEAKNSYFARLDELGEKGFIDLQMAG